MSVKYAILATEGADDQTASRLGLEPKEKARFMKYLAFSNLQAQLISQNKTENEIFLQCICSA